jgi:hypothetical protein
MTVRVAVGYRPEVLVHHAQTGIAAEAADA